MKGTSTPANVCTKLERIAELAKRAPTMKLRTLAHHIDIDWMHEAYRRTRKDGAVGVDGQTAKDYAVDLEGNLRSLLDRAKSGCYQAPPVRRSRGGTRRTPPPPGRPRPDRGVPLARRSIPARTRATTSLPRSFQ